VQRRTAEALHRRRLPPDGRAPSAAAAPAAAHPALDDGGRLAGLLRRGRVGGLRARPHGPTTEPARAARRGRLSAARAVRRAGVGLPRLPARRPSVRRAAPGGAPHFSLITIGGTLTATPDG